MSDDMWRRTGDGGHGERDDAPDDDFGELRFSDDEPADRTGDAPLSFGTDTGPLPHWTEPATGELPRLFPESPTGSGSRPRPHFSDEPTAPVASGSSDASGDDDVDIWGSYSGAAPRPVPDRPAPSEPGRRDDTSGSRPRVRLGDSSGGVRREPSGSVSRESAPPSGGVRRSGDTTETRRAPAGARRDDTGSRPTARPERGSRPTPRPAGSKASRSSSSSSPGSSSSSGPSSSSSRGTSGRDMPTAVAVGLIIAAAFIGALLWKPVAVLAIVVLVCGLAAIEFFDKVTERGYRPATIVGILAAIGGPLAAYWVPYFNQHWCSHAACYGNEHGHCSGYHYYCPAYGRWS